MEGITISPVNIDERKTLGIRAGDTVRVWQKIEEKGKTRLQAFEGLVLACKHGSEAGGTFTVRKVSNGVGIERIFPLYSPNIDKIEIVKRAKVRRSKLYYIREKVAREARRQLRRMQMMTLSTEGEQARALREAQDKAAREQAEAEAAEAAAAETAEAAPAETTDATDQTEGRNESETPAEEKKD